MKRILVSGLLVAVLLLSLSACNSNAVPKTETQANSPTAAAGSSPTQSATKAATPASSPTQSAPKASPTTAAPATSNTTADKLVTIADVEKVTGLTGIKIVPKDPSKGAGGDLNFATQNDELVLLVLVSGSSFYKPSKEVKGMFHADVSGIGDEAFDGPSDDTNFYKVAGGTADPFILVFRKGTTAVTLSSFLNMSQGKAYLSQDKLRELAKIVVSRM